MKGMQQVIYIYVFIYNHHFKKNASSILYITFNEVSFLNKSTLAMYKIFLIVLTEHTILFQLYIFCKILS